MNHYCYHGKKNFRKGFRALVAGGGTGDSLIYLGHQLSVTDAELVYLDLSEGSMEIALRRVRCRGFEHKVTWLHGSLLDLPQMGLDPFDYINCSGVLHHLTDPPQGLAALKSVLKDNGAIGIMLYGQYGRTGVYQMQELMRLVNRDETDSYVCVQNTRSTIDALPSSNWFKRSGGLSLLTGGQANDAEIFDMFMHVQDRAYTVPQLYELVENAGLHLVDFTLDFRSLFKPAYVVQDPQLLERIRRLPKRDQQTAAELLNGMITKHAFWVSHSAEPQIDLSDPDNVPWFSRMAIGLKIPESIRKIQEGDWVFKIRRNNSFELTLKIQPVPAAKRFIELIDEHRTLREIVDLIAAEYARRPSTDEVLKVCHHVMGVLRQCDSILLRHKSSPHLLKRSA